MTLLSVGLGFATMIIPRVVTFYVCTALLALFGFKLLYDGWKMKPDEGQEEFEEVSEELRKREEMVRWGGIEILVVLVLYPFNPFPSLQSILTPYLPFHLPPLPLFSFTYFPSSPLLLSLPFLLS